MICNVCKKEWVGLPDDTRCPHCGADLGKGADQFSIPDVIAFLIKKEGVDILLKPDTVMSYISDLVVGHDRDKKLMRVGSSNGAFQMAHSLLVEPKKSKREVLVLDMRRNLMDNAFLSEENATVLVNTVLVGIGLSSLRLNVAEKAVPESKPEPKPKPDPKPEAQRKKNPPPSAKSNPRTGEAGSAKKAPSSFDASRPSSQPRQNTQKKANNGQFRLNSISTFEYDGSSFASRKVQGSLFLRGEARMIGILVTYDPVPCDMNVSLEWQIFRQDGTSVTGLIHGGGRVAKGEFDYFQGWGWSVPGNWEVGRYTVRATMNGSNTVMTYFDVIEGRYDNPRLTMHGIRLFSSGPIPPALSDRMYSATFSAHQARRIYFEIGLLRMNVHVYTTLNYKIIKADGEVFANYSVPIRFHPGDDRCWTGFGWDEPGHWQKGRYRFEVSIGDANTPFCGYFDIV